MNKRQQFPPSRLWGYVAAVAMGAVAIRGGGGNGGGSGCRNMLHCLADMLFNTLT